MTYGHTGNIGWIFLFYRDLDMTYGVVILTWHILMLPLNGMDLKPYTTKGRRRPPLRVYRVYIGFVSDRLWQRNELPSSVLWIWDLL